MTTLPDLTTIITSTCSGREDGLMKFLTGVADVNATLRSLGTRKEAFPEFRDSLR